ncbi:MAG: hypothetical protein CYPHOPRED_000658 [Cyphobasidiales sp. Tagirdzhanova-0007]|nr:MAG: hypothetical protein CYPHOPRED_000658 [Cyphobasidiales sp. Tagirdzhanova-0007]
MVNAPVQAEPVTPLRTVRDRPLDRRDAVSVYETSRYIRTQAAYANRARVNRHQQQYVSFEYTQHPSLQPSLPLQLQDIHQQLMYHQQAPQQPSRKSEPHHRVYILRCAHCDAFMSDRGMRAVLLLKPHISLFSTDAPPVNCGPLYIGANEDPDEPEVKLERTCECLTQSLGCHGCGSINGYEIVSPCLRCTASITRPANGHRFVFHHNEVTFAERRYFPGEKGVRTDLVRHKSHRDRTTEASSTPQTPPTPAMQDADCTFDPDAKEGRERATAPSSAAVSPVRSSPSKRPRTPRGLEEGETIYWHYLVPGGELVRPADPQLRLPSYYAVGR